MNSTSDDYYYSKLFVKKKTSVKFPEKYLLE